MMAPDVVPSPDHESARLQEARTRIPWELMRPVPEASLSGLKAALRATSASRGEYVKHGHSHLDIRADCSRPCGRRRCTTPGAMLDTPLSSLYTRADVPVRAVAESEEVSMSAPHAAGWSRRESLGGLVLAGTTGELGLPPRTGAAEPPPLYGCITACAHGFLLIFRTFSLSW
jgi:hypothetical protein